MTLLELWQKLFGKPTPPQIDTLPSPWQFYRGKPPQGINGWVAHKQNAFVVGNDVVLRAIKERVTENGITVDYTSAQIHTKGKLEFRYGRLSADILLPKGKGLHPCFWLLGNTYDFTKSGAATGWPGCSEIDIIELGDTDKLRYGSGIHGPNIHTAVQSSVADPRGAWHHYWLNWTPRYIECGIDDRITAVWAPDDFTAPWVFNQTMFVVLFLRVEKPYAGAGADMVVRNLAHVPYKAT